VESLLHAGFYGAPVAPVPFVEVVLHPVLDPAADAPHVVARGHGHVVGALGMQGKGRSTLARSRKPVEERHHEEQQNRHELHELR